MSSAVAADGRGGGSGGGVGDGGGGGPADGVGDGGGEGPRGGEDLEVNEHNVQLSHSLGYDCTRRSVSQLQSNDHINTYRRV